MPFPMHNKLPSAAHVPLACLHNNICPTIISRNNNNQQDDYLNNYLRNDLKKDIEKVVARNSKTARLNELIYTLKECRGMLIDEDFNLDDYTKFFVKLRPYDQECHRLCYLLAKYMN